MYFLNGFVLGFLFGVTLSLVETVPTRPKDHYNCLACEIGFFLGISLGVAFLFAVFLYLYMQTG